MKEIYFDNAATTKTSLEAAKKVFEVMVTDYGNPSSLHQKGIRAEKEVNRTAEIIASVINANPNEIYFTSGGTESNNIAILGTAEGYSRRGKHIMTTQIEHPSVMQPFKALEKKGFQVTYLDVDSKGLIDVQDLKNRIKYNTTLVSVMFVNNEMGAIQNIELIGKSIKEVSSKILFHVDAVQGFGKYNICVNKCNIDLLSISGHKLHAPKGVGALYIRKDLNIKPLMYGGKQNNGLRPGTKNVPAIAGLGVATIEAYKELTAHYYHVKNLKHKLYNELVENITKVHINGDINNDSPYILNVTFKDLQSQILLQLLAKEGISISVGSTCSVRNTHSDPVTDSILKSLGIEDRDIEGVVRFSFSKHNTIEEVEQCVNIIKKVVPNLRKLKRN